MRPDSKHIFSDGMITTLPRKRCNIRRARTVVNGSLRWKHTCKLELRRKEKQYKAAFRKAIPVLKQLLVNQETWAPSKTLSEAIADQMFDALKGGQFARRCLCDGQ